MIKNDILSTIYILDTNYHGLKKTMRIPKFSKSRISSSNPYSKLNFYNLNNILYMSESIITALQFQQFQVSVKTSRKDEHVENALLRSQNATPLSF